MCDCARIRLLLVYTEWNVCVGLTEEGLSELIFSGVFAKGQKERLC
jgi:hypothetical protein